MLRDVIKCNPEVITVFTVEKAKEISQEAKKTGKDTGYNIKSYRQ